MHEDYERSINDSLLSDIGVDIFVRFTDRC